MVHCHRLSEGPYKNKLPAFIKALVAYFSCFEEPFMTSAVKGIKAQLSSNKVNELWG